MHSAIPITMLVPLLILGARASREAHRPVFLVPPSSGERVERPAPCDASRAAGVELRERLADLDRLVVELPSRGLAEQRETTRLVVLSLREVDLVLDRTASETQARFPTERFPSALLGRSIEELATIASAKTPDTAAFARRAQRLFGVLEACLEAVEDAPPAATTALDEPSD